MPSTKRLRRRTVLAGGLGGVGAFLTGTYAWNRYSRRHELRIRSLRCRNETTETVRLALTVGTDLERTAETTQWLAPKGEERSEQHVNGPWLKYPKPYSVSAKTADDTLVRSNEALIGELDSRFGPQQAVIEILVTPEHELEIAVEAYS
ncbi:hypothetical protein ACLI4U_16130 [Natrialbaceae archaeon A-CW2]|uniref:hypothetical protein n=1 Tax=Natronosalvus amylolyticus TaxID=2961994 RepID=UPI0020C944D5|nr:hypothetical protein [Natronosalvus amylolyticus]